MDGYLNGCIEQLKGRIFQCHSMISIHHVSSVPVSSVRTFISLLNNFSMRVGVGVIYPFLRFVLGRSAGLCCAVLPVALCCVVLLCAVIGQQVVLIL